jgi:hypothetical protein
VQTGRTNDGIAPLPGAAELDFISQLTFGLESLDGTPQQAHTALP